MLHVNLLLTITKSFVPLSCPNYIYHQTKSVSETILHHRSGIGFHSFTKSIAITNHITMWRFVGFSRSIVKSIVLILLYSQYVFNDFGLWPNCHVFIYRASKFTKSCSEKKMMRMRREYWEWKKWGDQKKKKMPKKLLVWSHIVGEKIIKCP